MTEVLDLSEINIGHPPDETGGAETPPLSPLDIKVCCNTNGDKTRENVLANTRRGLVEIVPLEENNEPIIIVGGGPSLSTNWQEVKWWQAQGARVLALNAAAGFLNGHGIKPDFQLIVDPRPENVSLIADAGAYFFASQCAPEMFDAKPDAVLLHMVGSAKDLVNGTLIGGDITVGLVAMCLAHTLGFRTQHLYGYDSSYEDVSKHFCVHHAYPQSQTPQEEKRLEVYAADENGIMQKFTTNFAMAKQAELFPKTAELLCNAGTQILVHGTGLVPTLARGMRKKVETRPHAAE